MNKQILALCLIAGAALTSFARPTVLSLKENIQDSTIVYPQSFETDTQELMKNWYLQNYAVVDRSGANLSDVPTSDKDFIARLQKMPTVIEMPYNGVDLVVVFEVLGGHGLKQEHLFAAGQRRQLLGLGSGAGHRLFHNDMLPRFQRHLGIAVMLQVGHGQLDHIHPLQ